MSSAFDAPVPRADVRRPWWTVERCGLPRRGGADRRADAGVASGASSGTFLPARYLSTGSTETNAVAMADVTGDGKPDILSVAYTKLALLQQR